MQLFKSLHNAKNKTKLRHIAMGIPRVAGKTVTLGFQVIGVSIYLADRALDKALNAGKETVDNWNQEEPEQLELDLDNR